MSRTKALETRSQAVSPVSVFGGSGAGAEAEKGDCSFVFDEGWEKSGWINRKQSTKKRSHVFP
jgi:hypothetical protein